LQLTSSHALARFEIEFPPLRQAQGRDFASRLGRLLNGSTSHACSSHSAHLQPYCFRSERWPLNADCYFRPASALTNQAGRSLSLSQLPALSNSNPAGIVFRSGNQISLIAGRW